MNQKLISNHLNPEIKNRDLQCLRREEKREGGVPCKQMKMSLLQESKKLHQEHQKLKTSHLRRYRSNEKISTQLHTPKPKNLALITPINITVARPTESLRNKIQQNKKVLEKIKTNFLQAKEHKLTLFKSNQLALSSLSEKNSLKTSLTLDTESLFRSQTMIQLGLAARKQSEECPFKEKPQREILSLQFKGKIQHFLIVRFLDSGSFGKVYLVQHMVTNFIMALKVINKSELNEENLKNLVREIKIQSSLSHPNILNIYGYTSDAEKVYLLLEPCLGSNIFKKLIKEPLAEKEVKKNIKEVCSAVQYLHKKDVIHRDIKAENILLHGNTIKLCDFGWAVHAPMLRSTQCGTPLYTPPQIVKNQSYDSKVDVWCIGVLTYEMLYGTSPFEIRQIEDLAKIVDQEVFFSKEIPVSCMAKDFMRNCLRKNPAERLTVRQALEHDFLAGKTEVLRSTLG